VGLPGGVRVGLPGPGTLELRLEGRTKGREIQAGVTPWVSRGEHRVGWGERHVVLDFSGNKTTKAQPCLRKSFDLILLLLGSYECIVSNREHGVHATEPSPGAE